MNLLCDVSIFQVNHIFFLDTKKNMVIDGKFTKIVYSDSVVSLNGLYLYCPIESDQKTLTKNTSRLMTTDDVILTPSRIENKNLVENHGSTIVTKKIPFMFSLLNPTNIYLIKELNRIEHEIIEHYKEFFQIHKTNVYSLRNQLKSGNIRVVHKIPYLFSDYEPILLTSNEVGTDTYDCARPNYSGDLQSPSELVIGRPSALRPIVVKISGIWETDMNIGITFKFQI